MSIDDRATQMEMWSPEVNNAIVRVPGRRFPGVLIQGDSLSTLFDLAMTLAERLSTTSDSELRSTAEELEVAGQHGVGRTWTRFFAC